MYNENRKTLILLLLGIIIVSISIAYASLATSLNIGGTVNAPSVNWDVHFINFSTQTPASGNTGQIISVDTSNTSIERLKAELKKPGDSITYNFDIKNFGNIDAKLTSFTSNITCSTGNCNHATYTVTCLDSSNNTFTQNQVLAPNAVINCSLYLKYKNDANISDDVSATVSANWTFSQN